MRFSTITVLTSILIVSCEKTLEVKVPVHEKKIVINAQWGQGRKLAAKITRSRGISETFSNYNEQYLVTNAFVIVKENNIVIDTLKYDSLNSVYSSLHQRNALSDRTYTIEASAPGFPDATGVSSMPYFTKPLTVTVKRNARIGTNGGPEAEITVTFKDSSALNYYVFRIRQYQGGSYSCVYTSDKDIEKTGSTDLLDKNTCFEADKLLFTDKTYNGHEKKIVFYTDDFAVEPYINPQTGRVERAWIEMLHVNEDYFKYIKSVENYSDAGDNPFAEPVNVINNIQNGYGFFTTYSIAVDTLR